MFLVQRYNATVYLSNITVYKSSTAQPIVSIIGSHYYSSANKNYNGKVSIQAQISFDYDCELDYNDIQSVDYSLKWMVLSADPMVENVTVNNDTLNGLRNYLMNESNSELSIYADTYLQPGVLYYFQLTLNCIISGVNVSNYTCIETNINHWVRYEYSAIQCQISGGNQYLMNNLSEYEIVLDGNTFTYDLDVENPISDKNHLQGQWSCLRNGMINCTSTLFRANGGEDSLLKQLYFDTEYSSLEIDNIYQYDIQLSVVDSNHPLSRDACIAVTSIIVNTSADLTSAFSVSITTLKSTINIAERLRLLGTHVSSSDVRYEYLWTEVNGLLTNEAFISDNTTNLIVMENELKIGIRYQFEFIVYEYFTDGSLSRQGKALSTVISVFYKPMIIEDSFTLYPNCSMISSSDFVNELQKEFSLSVTADGEYSPLEYLFSYSGIYSKIYFNTLSTVPYLDIVFFPIGNINLTITVFDTGM